MFDWIGSNLGWGALTCVGLLVFFGIVGSFSLQTRAQNALKKQGLLEALQVLNTGTMDDEVTKLLNTQLPDWPISGEIKSAVSELQQLRAGIDVATKAGVPANMTDQFKQNTTKALDQIWHLSERVAAAGAQKVEYSAVESVLQPDLEQVARVCETAKQARLSLAQLTLTDQDASGKYLDEAATRLRDLSDAANSMRATTSQVTPDIA